MLGRTLRGLGKTLAFLGVSLAIRCAAPQAAPVRAESSSEQSAPVPSASAPQGAPATPASAAAPADASPPAPSAVASCEPPSADANPARASDLPFQFTLEREGKLSSLAVNEHKLAVFGDPRSAVFDGARWKELPDLESTREPRHLQLFFGRDDQPRVIGYLGPSEENATLEPFYRRFKAGRWQREPAELGALASGGGALYGVLGTLDPEVVCRPKALCLVKRISGWTRIPAHDAPVRIVLAGGTAWALSAGHVQRLEPTGFTDWGPPRAWREPRAIWLDSGGSPWVLEPSERALYRLEANTWVRLDTPFTESTALWGSASAGVWLVGSGGAAHFDGKAWRCVPGVRGPLSAIIQWGDELWLAGATGAFRGRPRSPR
jgi:hypothetical protein